MNIIKDLMLCLLFLCMFAVLLLFAQLNSEIQSSSMQHDVIIHSQVKVIYEDMVLIRKQKQEIDELKSELVDIKELYFVQLDRLENREKTIKALTKKLRNYHGKM